MTPTTCAVSGACATKTDPLLWLWILLGCLGGAAIIGVAIWQIVVYFQKHPIKKAKKVEVLSIDSVKNKI